MVDYGCTPANCTVSTGTTTNGTIYAQHYDSSVPVNYRRQRMELATICIVNFITIVVILGRLCYRWRKLHLLKWDDKCILAAGFFMIPYTVCQLGANVYGSGLKMVNVPHRWRYWHWHFTIGYAGFYIITSFIKLSVCLCFLELLPHHMKRLRYCLFSLSAIIISLGIINSMAWIFECQPFLSNFLWSVDGNTCINYDIFRWLWVAVSIPIDVVFLIIPYKLLQQVLLQEHERRILKMVFSATLLGTITCILSVYGIWEGRTSENIELYYQEVIFIMMNDIEICMYTLGASFPVLSRYLVARAASRQPVLQAPNSNFSSWARGIPNFFPMSRLPLSTLFYTRQDSDRHSINAPSTPATLNEPCSMTRRHTSESESSNISTIHKDCPPEIEEVHVRIRRDDEESGKTLWVSEHADKESQHGYTTS